MDQDSEQGEVPVLAYVFQFHPFELSPLGLTAAADGLCRMLWVLREAGPETADVRRALARLGEIVDVSGLSDAEAAAAIAARGAAGIACFTDPNILWTARIAALLGLPFHSTDAAVALTDKLRQRAALREAGLRTPGFWQLDGPTDSAAIARIEADARFPAVLKPRSGSTSIDVQLIASMEQLRASITDRPGGMLVEEYIPDPSSPLAGVGNASYVSVELLADRGEPTVLGVTGRPPLAPPFRETGSIYPAELSAESRDDVVALAIAAVRALGVEFGSVHTELKLTDDGPVVIEVNGRPGGGTIPTLLRRAHGIDVVTESMRIALGRRLELAALNEPDDVGFFIAVQPSAELTRITSIEGIGALGTIDGVDQVVPNRRPGDAVSWRDGSLGFVVGVSGAAADHDEERRIRREVLERLVVTGETGAVDSAPAGQPR